MENIVTYSGGGDSIQSIYCRDARSTYLAMRDDLMRQRIEGFGEWEFLRLLAPTVTGEAREVHNAYMDEWNFVNRSNPNFRRETPSAIPGCGILYLRIIKSTQIISLHRCNHQHRDNTICTNSSDKMECTNMN